MSDKILNPKTNRYVKKDGKIGRAILQEKLLEKKCSEKEIVNPKTNRCVKKDSKIGKAILQEKLLEKKCSSKEILNPKTNRCVKKDGKIGKEILNPKTNRCVKKDSKIGKKILKEKVPSSFFEVKKSCKSIKNWGVEGLVDQGKYGEIYTVCKDKNDCEYILKMQKAGYQFRQELKCLLELQNKNLVPKVYAYWICKDFGYIVMDKFKQCPIINLNSEGTRKVDYKNIKALLTKMEKNGWLHVDIHPGNFMCDNNGNYYLIDFGWSVKKGQKYYPDHPLAILWNYNFTWEDLKLIQKTNFEKFFGTKNNYMKLSKKIEKFYK
jgi:serine/threonine protein kinase